MTNDRKRVACIGCGRLCRTISGRCQDCNSTESPFVLLDGRWVTRRGGIHIWVEAS